MGQAPGGLRRLVYAQDAGWEEVSGVKEPWEDEVLFSALRLEAQLGREGPDGAAGVHEAWAQKALVVNGRIPSVVAVFLQRDVEAALGLPPPTSAA